MAKKQKDGKTSTGERVVCTNRKARHLYFIDETLEAGMVLQGTEVKSLRAGKGSLQESYARIKNEEVWLHQFHIPPYEQGNIWNADPVRPRKLLLHRREIDRLEKAIERQGATLVPLKIYFSHGKVKVELGVARGKKAHDKREDIKQRDQQRDMDRAMK